VSRRYRAALLCFAALTSLLATSALIRAALSFTAYRDTDIVTELLHRVLSDPAVDTVFVGSSRTFTMVDPIRYDSALLTGGRSSHAYIAGIYASGILDIEAFTEALLRTRPPHLTTVFLEPDFAMMSPLRTTIPARSIHYFTIANAVRALRYVGALPASEPREEFAANILRWTLTRQVNLGLLRVFLSEYDAGWRKMPVVRGYHARPAAKDEFIGQPEALASFARQRALIAAAYRDREDLSAWLPERHWRYFANIVERLRANGIQVVLLHTPQTVGWQQDLAYVLGYPSRCIPGVPLFDFSDPNRYPQLWAIENRLDHDHLNAAGSEIYTDAIAERMLGFLAAGPASACPAR
jgi:hypothetical protein